MVAKPEMTYSTAIKSTKERQSVRKPATNPGEKKKHIFLVFGELIQDQLEHIK